MRKPCILSVIGTGRCGSSLMMQTLGNLGIGMSKQLIGPSDSNKRGAFEDKYIFESQNTLLRELGLHNYLVKPQDWENHPITIKVKNDLMAYIDARLRNVSGNIWAFKDPKSILFLPMWEKIARDIGVEIKHIICARSPSGTIGSICHHYKTPIRRANATYAMRLRALLEDFPKSACTIHFEDWPSNYKSNVNQILEYLDLSNIEVPLKATNTIYRPSLDNSKLFDNNSRVVLPLSMLLYNSLFKDMPFNMLRDRNEPNLKIPSSYEDFYPNVD